ncbi:hypothetical protein [Amycolatopsis sp. PS_44_ISF1]|uniref:hypothetical protein n=1 Tax=Amycolatopsis sp. PS_44_ISF1 TaxID=2974917 RepID=UPI0028DEEDF2|nr:hypothetical protein [Amycolatopsis sp. PS_44_ISF1]MDT8915807.1 hypothetical protein [Amycolatopsis sp. PS_44_ISF1]
MDKATNVLLRQLKTQGFDVKRTRSLHYMIRKGGKFVTIIGSTPSEYRGRQNGLAALRRAGFVDPKRQTR